MCGIRSWRLARETPSKVSSYHKTRQCNMNSTLIAMRSLCLFSGFCLSVFPVLPTTTAVSQEIVDCPGLPGKYVVLEDQNYALCAGARSVNFGEITYAKCAIKHNQTSISAVQSYPFPSVPPSPDNIDTVNEGAPINGYMVSTFSPPPELTSPSGNLALYTCNAGGAYAQCDGGLCFTSTRAKQSPPLWGAVSSSQIVCSCPIATPKTSYQVFGPNQCPTTPKEYDEICAAGVTKINNGAMIYVGAPVGVPEKLAACLMGEPQKFNKCDRPSD